MREKTYEKFKEKFHLALNPEQEQAVMNTEGKTLLLAVPGSGKTTVLVNRLGYMIRGLGIPPESVLAITFNRLAAMEIQKRYRATFGNAGTEGLTIQTINSLSLKIYSRFCRVTGHPFRETIDQEKKTILLNVYRRFSENKFPGESELAEVETAFTYIKNMCIEPEEAEELFQIEQLTEMYKAYEKTLKSAGKMDFDDQMVFAKWILQNRPSELAYWRQKYRYVCVDEAQDTSKIQHEIIRLLAEESSLFMVGDEDQSIYGFRAAFPEALLRFRTIYRGGEILKMETNYRSHGEIVSAASDFISKNTGRYRKNMTAARGPGGTIKYIEAESRGDQFLILADEAERAAVETAFLYRDNESSIALADLLLRRNIPFSYSKSKMNFFQSKTVTDYMAYLCLIADNEDLDAFAQIGNKSSLGLNREKVNYITASCRRTGFSLFDVVKTTEGISAANTDTFITLVKNLKEEKPSVALRKIRAVVYSSYLEKFHIDDPAFETLVILAEKEDTIEGFLQRTEYLKNYCGEAHLNSGDNRIILSTIHSAKGREFKQVYLFDVYDEKFSSGIRNLKGKQKEKEVMEERRLFYVAMTRAEDSLKIVGIRNRKSAYLDQIFGKKRGRGRKHAVKPEGTGFTSGNTPREQQRKKAGLIPPQQVIAAFAEKRTDRPVKDKEGNLWLKCRICGKIKGEERFALKGPEPCYGVCRKCREKERQ